MFKITGMLPALLTPFDAEGNVNLTAMRDLIEWHITQDVAGFYILGSTGEGLLLSEAERRMVAEAVVQQVKGRVPVIVHVGAITTQTACDLAAHAGQIGADAVSAIPPFYFNVGPEGVKQHYLRIGTASSLPFYIYSIPGTTGVNISVDTVRDLIKAMPTLRGMKYTAYDFYTMRKIIELEGGRLNVVSGPDEMMLAGQAMGADGAIGTTQNILPRVFVQAYNAFHAGDLAAAQALQAKINWVVDIFLQFPSFSAVKEIMRLLGFDLGAGRRPNLPLTDEQRGRIREMLEEVGFFQFATRR
ncbi:MAG: dihydrodipicolinate synthase family protein [Chloroflexi bacterium]|nr:dihydrodipicolinate synthase family protein [Chloroflexota bacterium]